MLTINNILKSSIVVLFLALGTFAFSEINATPFAPNCEVCSGRFDEHMSCERVNIGGYHECISVNGDCTQNGSGCEIQHT